MDLLVSPDGWLACDGVRFRCALGKGGIKADKREGDGATPVGMFPLRRVLYRKDRLARPSTALDVWPIGRDDGWCDDPADAVHYNRQVRLPHASHCERLWRADNLYDVVVVLGHNDAPPLPGAGSAIFLHVARPDYAATEGCVALTLIDLLWVLQRCDIEARVCIEPDVPAVESASEPPSWLVGERRERLERDRIRGPQSL